MGLGCRWFSHLDCLHIRVRASEARRQHLLQPDRHPLPLTLEQVRALPSALLREARRAGVVIRNEALTSETQFPEWMERYGAWREQTLKAAANISRYCTTCSKPSTRCMAIRRVWPPSTASTRFGSPSCLRFCGALEGRTARNPEPVDPAIGTTHMCQRIVECGLLTGSGHWVAYGVARGGYSRTSGED